MASFKYDVVGIGNAIVDIIGRCDDAFLAQVDAPKGAMRLVDSATIADIYKVMGQAVEISGGSAANTMAGIASFGGKGGFIGKVADDEFGKIFAHDIRAAGIDFTVPPVAGREPTSRSLILVTPDGQRTMNTFLGISTALDQGEVDAELIADAGILYLEGYLFDRPEAKSAFRDAVAIARKAGRKVALSLSDGFCVDRHRAEFLALIKDGIDIVFANESEITSLYQVSDFATAATHAKNDIALAVLTRSERGSVILTKTDEVSIAVEAVEKVVDTTGAGDLYASGFLFGLARNLPLATAGALGSLAAAEIISHIGARPEKSLEALAKAHKLI